MNTQAHFSNASRITGMSRQAGFTLIETLISLALSVVVTSAMVALMGNSLGTTTRIIQMTQLTDQLRNTMSMLTRDIRRANYSANAAYCYANSDCGLGGDINGSTDNSAKQWGDINVTDGSCVVFGIDRDFDGNSATDNAGGFRRVATGGIGRIEMWIGDNAPNCAAINNAGWVAVTDPDFVDITTFAVNDAASFNGSIIGETTTITARTRQIQVQIEGRVIRDNTITRRIEDTINARNDTITKTPNP